MTLSEEKAALDSNKAKFIHTRPTLAPVVISSKLKQDGGALK